MHNYPMLIEVAGQEHPEGDFPSCLYRAEYRQGSTLSQDELKMDWDPIFMSGTSEDLEAHYTPTGGVSFLWSRRRPRQLYVIERDRETPRRLVDQMLRMARYSPDGREISYLAPDAPRGARWEWALWTCSSDGSNARLVPTPGLPVRYLDYSPDGRSLWLSLWAYFEPGPRGLYRRDRASGSITRLAGGDFQEFCVSPDGHHLAFIGNRGEQALATLDLRTGQERVLRWLSEETRTVGESDLNSPVYSPDGQRIFYCVHHYDGDWSLTQLCVTTPHGGACRVIWEEEGPARVVVPRLQAPARELVGAGRLTGKLPG